MTPDAALDQLAFLVGLRLIGPDARRRLRIALLRHPEIIAPSSGLVESIERLDELLDGRRAPATLQERIEVARAEQARAAPPFHPGFWACRVADLAAAGFPPESAARIVGDVRARVEAAPDHQSQREELEPCSAA